MNKKTIWEYSLDGNSLLVGGFPVASFEKIDGQYKWTFYTKHFGELNADIDVRYRAAGRDLRKEKILPMTALVEDLLS